MSKHHLYLVKPSTEAEKITHTVSDTIEITPKSVLVWRNPPFQRPKRVKAAGLSADEEECREIHRVLSKPIREFSDRNASKNAAGFKIATPAVDLPEEDVESGQRHAVLKSLAATLRSRGADLDEIEAALLAANEVRCNPSKSRAEIRAIARDAVSQPTSSSVDPRVGNPCCGNVGTYGEGGREYCSTCGQELS